MKARSLSFKFTLIFIGFTVVALLMSSVLSYFNQMQTYRNQCEKNVQHVASYLEEILMSEGNYFLFYQDYFLLHKDDLMIPIDFGTKDIVKSEKKFKELFAKKYPGEIFTQSSPFDEFDDELKSAYTVYKHQYYLDKFEKARMDFELIYVEYMVPAEKPYHLTYVLDSMREPRMIAGKDFIELGITVPNPLEEHKKEWEAWETGKRPNGYDTFDNEFGKTFAFYTPLYVSGRKMGIIGVEVEIAKVNREILLATVKQMMAIGIMLIILMLLLLYLIRINYIQKLIKLQEAIADYSLSKNPLVAEKLTAEGNSGDEISLIITKFADMIYELELYMQSLSKTKDELQNTKKHAVEMSELALKDPLTGIRNRNGYYNEVKKLEWEISDGEAKFGIAMIDLNFLKKINDTYGHEIGNRAIISLCRITCSVFEHSPVFRVGGDEFVAILRDHDLECADILVHEFKRKLESLKNDSRLEFWEQTSAAIGYAVFDSSVDSDYESVLKRADVQMYENKKAMKAMRED